MKSPNKLDRLIKKTNISNRGVPIKNIEMQIKTEISVKKITQMTEDPNINDKPSLTESESLNLLIAK